MTSKSPHPDIEILRSSGLFDDSWYRQRYSDVGLTGIEPIKHYMKYGCLLRRHPSEKFDSRWYESQYSDVKNSGQCPVLHFLTYGCFEGRKTKPVGRLWPDFMLSPGRRFVTRRVENWDHDRERHFADQIELIYRENSAEIDKTLVSIVMPAYNRQDIVSDAIESVISQTHSNFELLVVDDGSTDNTGEVIKKFSYKDSRVHYIRGTHQGVSAARNLGLEHVSGQYVFYLDSDNTWIPSHIRFMLTFMETFRIGAAYSGILCEGNKIGKYYRGDDFSWHRCHELNYVDLNSFAHKASLLKLGEKFDVKLKRLVDWDFILRLTRITKTVYLPFIGVRYFDGDTHGRITTTVAQDGAVEKLQSRIREKINRLQPSAHNDDVQYATAEQYVTGSISNFSKRKASELVASNASVILDHQDYSALLNDAKSRDQLLISIIIVCYEKSDLTKACLESICTHAPGEGISFEVIVVDNGSRDDTTEVVQSFKQRIPLKYVRNESNLMFSMGNNVGAAAAKGAFLVFLNNDTVVTPGWLRPLYETLSRNQNIGIVGPKLLYPDETVQCAGIVFNSISSIPYHIYRGYSRNHPSVNKARFYQAFTGACLGIRAEDFFVLEGFDTRYVNGCEDIDLCLKLKKNLNKTIFYEPRSEVFHYEGKTEGRGKNIAYNRELFALTWGQVAADDLIYYQEDGLSVSSYEKRGAEQHGPLAAYTPILGSEAKNEGTSERTTVSKPKTWNIGFVSIWHVRGISIHTLQIARSLESNALKTFIFARWESERFSNEHPVHHPRVFNGGNDPSDKEFLDWCRQNEIDALIFMEVHPKDWKRVKAAKDAGIKVICYENLDILRLEFIDRYEMFDGFLFNTFHTRDVMLDHFPDKPSFTIPWGIEPQAISTLPDSDDHSTVRFAHVAGWGGVNNRKNTGLLVEAFHQAGEIDAELHLYTQSPMSAFGDNIEHISQKNRNIHVYEGTIDDITEAYVGKDMLLWPSKREGVGLPILEALVHGLPVLISDGYMMKQWIKPGVHGVVCPADPAQGLMQLPEMQVDKSQLAMLIRHLSEERGMISKLKSNVLRDKKTWLWTWQKNLIKILVERFCSDPDDVFFQSLDYLPEDVIEFENERRSAFNEQKLG